MSADTAGAPPAPDLRPAKRCAHSVVVPEALHGFEPDDTCLLHPVNGHDDWDRFAVQVEIGRCPACGSTFARTTTYRYSAPADAKSTAWAWMAST